MTNKTQYTVYTGIGHRYSTHSGTKKEMETYSRRILRWIPQAERPLVVKPVKTPRK